MQQEKIALPSRDGTVALRRWTGEASGQVPALALLHANGLTAASYHRVLAPLASTHGAIAWDHRGHGDTALPAEPETLRDWHVYAEDAEAVLLSQPAPEDGWVLAGHSMGAYMALSVAARGKVPVRAIAMMEPVIVPSFVPVLARSPLRRFLGNFLPVARQAAGRRAEFDDRDTVLDAYRRKSFFAGWADGVLEDYVDSAFRAEGTGVRLACDPAWEAATFIAQGHSFWQALDGAAGNADVSALYAEKASTSLPVQRRRMARRGVNGSVVPGTTHLLPQERPDLAAAFLRDVLATAR